MIISALKLLFAAFYSVFMATIELLLIPFHRTGKLYHAIARLHARGTLAVCGVKLVVRGLERVDFSRNYIYVSNHASFFDIPAVLAGIPDQVRLVYKKELEKIPFFGWGLKYGKTYIGIDRGNSSEAIRSLETAAERIRNGASVLLFAEGTRTPDGKLQPFKRGAFNLAMRAGVPVVPLAIQGSFDVLPRHSWRIKPGTITLVLGAPIALPSANGKSSEFKLMEDVHSAIERQCSEQ